MKNYFLKKRGLTLVETLVAISILSISILATFTAVQNGLKTSTFAKDQITAFYLVQDAMESIRNVRDQNAITTLQTVPVNGTPVDWLSGIAEKNNDPCYFGKTCAVDSPHPSPAPFFFNCNGSFTNCPYLRQDPVSGRYGYSAGWTATRFRRGVQLTKLSSSGDEIMVTIDITWTSGNGVTKSFQVRQELFNIN